MQAATEPRTTLDAMDHVAIAVQEIAGAVLWYQNRFQCEVIYQDDSWALLRFANIKLALVLPDQHPPHLGFVHPDAKSFGPLQPHRDGTRSTYIRDLDHNSIELLQDTSD